VKVLKNPLPTYVNDPNTAMEFHEQLLSYSISRNLKLPQIGLELAQVGDILLAAGSVEALKLLEARRLLFF
jgi:hypothetical protein